MNQSNQATGMSAQDDGPGHNLRLRAAFLFANFFLITVVLYQLKPVSRSLLIESLGVDSLPYVWIGTALALGTALPFYCRLMGHFSRLHAVLGSLLIFITLLVLFRIWLSSAGNIAATAFYIFVDVFAVVLVEQLWSLTNSIYNTEEGKRWYGIIGTGGLVGSVIGGGIAALLIKYTPLQTVDLLLVAAAILGLIGALTWVMGKCGVYRELKVGISLRQTQGGWRVYLRSRYLLLIALILFLAQVATPFVEYQFLKTVEGSYRELQARTAFLSTFFGVLGMISIGVNILITPLVHRKLGVIAGLLVQPIMLALSAYGFMLQSGLFLGAAMKICDRALSYSINRVSKELLYVPMEPVLTYQAKAWIDMFGYRLFKALGSVMILLLTQWLPVTVGLARLSVVTLGLCLAWVVAVLYLQDHYKRVLQPA
jgi:AAA family ATP:ADP antiporter